MPRRPDAQELTGFVYAALLGEGTWRDFLDELSRLLPNGKALLFFHDAAAGMGAFPLNSGLDPDRQATYDTYYSTINPWMHGASVRPLGRVVRAESMLCRERLHGTEFYSDWLRVEGLASGIGVTIRREQHCNFLLSVLCADAEDALFNDAVRTMQKVVPHLGRAFEWYRRGRGSAFDLLDGNGLVENLRLGTVTIGAGRKVGAVSAAAEAIMGRTAEVSVDRAGRFHCAAPGVVDCIDAMLAGWMRERRGVLPSSFLLPRGSQTPPTRLTIVAPPGGRETRFFRGPECVVLLEEATPDMGRAAEEFGSLHGLTPAETRVVAGLAAGQTLNEVAARAGTAPGTVSKQLKNVFAKTGIARQAELIRHVSLVAQTFIGPSASAMNPRPAIR